MLYRLATELAAPVVTPLLKRRRNGVSPDFAKSFFNPLEKTGKMPEKGAIWLHCASAGEVVAAQPLIETLLLQETSLFVTLWSPNGVIKLHQLFGDQVPWSWLPWDRLGPLSRWMDALSPAELWVLETELWPHLLLAAREADVPVRIVNARITHKTLRAPAFLRTAWREALGSVTQVLARGSSDAEAFVQLGAPSERVSAAGNLKELAAARLAQQPPRPLRQAPFLLFASAYDDEIEGLMPMLAEMSRPLPWVIVPRRPDQDAEYVRLTAEEQGLTTVMVERDEQADAEADVLIETRFGTLTRWLSNAAAVMMGGSFAPYGGHNFLEAAALGRAIITGSDMRDFTEETEAFVHAGALIQLEDMEEAVETATRLATSPDKARALGERARATLLEREAAVRQRYFTALGLNPDSSH